jgi:hypothetical protein
MTRILAAALIFASIGGSAFAVDSASPLFHGRNHAPLVRRHPGRPHRMPPAPPCVIRHHHRSCAR